MMDNRQATLTSWSRITAEQTMQPILMIALDGKGRGALVPSVAMVARLKEKIGDKPQEWYTDEIKAAVDNLLGLVTKRMGFETSQGEKKDG